MMESRLSEKIVRNTLFNVLGRAWGVLVVFFLTPYIISRIGIERYGVWSVFGVLTGFFGLFDLGFGTSFVKYISEFYTKKDYKKINEVVNTGFTFYAAFGLAIFITVAIFIHPILRLFNIPQPFYSEALFVFMVGVALFLLSDAFGIFGCIQYGLQRMDIVNVLAIPLSILNVIGTIFFLEKGYGLRGLICNSVVISLLAIAANFIIAFRILPGVKFNPCLFSRGMFKRMFGYGIMVQVSRLEDFFTFHMVKLFISNFLNITLVGIYQIGILVIDKVRMFPLFLCSAVMPAVAELDAKHDTQGIYDLYRRGTKYLAALGIPMFVFVFIAASVIIRAWIGKDYQLSVLVIQILAPCYMLNVLTGTISSILLGIGRPDFLMKTGLFQLVLNIILSLVLLFKIGFAGVAIATLISLSLSSSWLTVMFHRYMRYSLWDSVKKIFLPPFFVSLACGVIPVIVISFAGRLYPDSGRLFHINLLILNSLLFAAVYVCVILKIGYFDAYDKGLITQRLGFLKKFKNTDLSCE